MDQSNVEEQKYGRCIGCKQISTSLLCYTCDSTFKGRESGKCIVCKQIKQKAKGTRTCRTCYSTSQEQKYGRCIECKQTDTGKDWCQICNSKRFQQNFDNWTSNNDDVDKFIQNIQLSAKNRYQLLEWIPYDRFSEVVYVAKGGFGKVYKAIWQDGKISHWDVRKNQWERNSARMYVALKSLNGSQNLKSQFINEITSQLKIVEDRPLDQFIRCFGVSQDPNTKEYIMVMKFADWGGLRNYFDKRDKYEKKRKKLLEENILYWKLRRKIIALDCIAAGLRRIHVKGLIHRDLHTGNIVCFKNMICITDMGLCKPANYEELETTENNAYGVLPYVAPEVLRGEHYTQASDIYSFGVIMYEVISEMPPYYNINHDEVLAVEICKGLRPNFNIKVPQLIIELIKKCLDAKPSNRPNAKDLARNFKELIIDFRRKSELIKQIEEISNNLSDLPSSIDKMDTMHSGAIYTSRLLSFKHLPEPKNSDDYYENFDNITSIKYSECLDCKVTD